MLKEVLSSFLNGCAYELGSYFTHVIMVEVEKKRKEKTKETKKKRAIGFNANAA